ncbi:MAG: zinc ABC transporter substrate-binding protein [Spirochaetes bacterium]|jgi:zinc transport system substrate-binding protein|nr:zinc ABC transporter substrate-binding protein [Spirochaetota bacterium]
MRNILITITCLILVLSVAGCKKPENNQKITVFVSILPQKYFVEKIAGDRVNVEVLVSPGKNPATYEPTPQQVIKLGDARILFTIGVPFEDAFLPKIESVLNSLKIVDTSHGIDKRNLDFHHDDEEDHHDENPEQYVGTPDPHIWLSPLLVKIQAETIYNALIEIDPDGQSVYASGYQSLQEELDELSRNLEKTLKPFKGSTLFVFHPAFGYFADEFGLNQVAIETGGKEPTPAVLVKIIENARKRGVKIIFVQPEFSRESAKKIAEAINGAVVILNPLNPDYVNNLKSISFEIEKAFK